MGVADTFRQPPPAAQAGSENRIVKATVLKMNSFFERKRGELKASPNSWTFMLGNSKFLSPATWSMG